MLQPHGLTRQDRTKSRILPQFKRSFISINSSDFGNGVLLSINNPIEVGSHDTVSFVITISNHQKNPIILSSEFPGVLQFSIVGTDSYFNELVLTFNESSENVIQYSILVRVSPTAPGSFISNINITELDLIVGSFQVEWEAFTLGPSVIITPNHTNYSFSRSSGTVTYTITATGLTSSLLISISDSIRYKINTTLSSLELIQSGGSISTTFTITYTAPADAGEYPATLSISGADIATRTISYIAFGSVLPLPVITLTPNESLHSFGSSSGSRTYTLNAFNLVGNVIATLSGTGIAQYSFVGTSSKTLTFEPTQGSNELGVISSRTFTVVYTAPADSNSHPGVLTLSTSTGSDVTVSFFANGTIAPPPNQLISINSTPGTNSPVGNLSFSKTEVSQSSFLSFTISGSDLTSNVTLTSNSTNYTLSLTQAGTYTSSLNLSHGTGTLATTTVWVRFIPTIASSQNSTISILSTGITGSITTQGQGAVVSISATITNFTVSSTLNRTSTVTVSSSNISNNFSIVSSNSTNFQISSSSVSPNGSIVVTFNDEGLGRSLSSTLTFTSEGILKTIVISGTENSRNVASVSLGNIVYLGSDRGSDISFGQTNLNLNPSFTISTSWLNMPSTSFTVSLTNSNPDVFTINPTLVPVSGNGSQIFTVTFNNSVNGTYTATLVLSVAGFANRTYNITGIRHPDATFSLTPSSFTFQESVDGNYSGVSPGPFTATLTATNVSNAVYNNYFSGSLSVFINPSSYSASGGSVNASFSISRSATYSYGFYSSNVFFPLTDLAGNGFFPSLSVNHNVIASPVSLSAVASPSSANFNINSGIQSLTSSITVSISNAQPNSAFSVSLQGSGLSSSGSISGSSSGTTNSSGAGTLSFTVNITGISTSSVGSAFYNLLGQYTDRAGTFSFSIPVPGSGISIDVSKINISSTVIQTSLTRYTLPNVSLGSGVDYGSMLSESGFPLDYSGSITGTLAHPLSAWFNFAGGGSSTSVLYPSETISGPSSKFRWISTSTAGSVGTFTTTASFTFPETSTYLGFSKTSTYTVIVSDATFRASNNGSGLSRTAGTGIGNSSQNISVGLSYSDTHNVYFVQVIANDTATNNLLMQGTVLNAWSVNSTGNCFVSLSSSIPQNTFSMSSNFSASTGFHFRASGGHGTSGTITISFTTGNTITINVTGSGGSGSGGPYSVIL